MCGIAGVISLDGSSLKHCQIKKMTDSIRHRGPDGTGYLIAQTGRQSPRKGAYENVFTDAEFSDDLKLIPAIDTPEAEQYLNQYDWDILLGHRRLSIIDLSSAGFQPMSDVSRNIWLVYNGEIYNYKDIQSELIALGYEFRSNSDTEVLIHAYNEWGIDFIHKLNGMFAFALLDKNHQQIYLVRDRYGIKPLYYSLTKCGHFAFGSEVKAILESESYSNSIDMEALVEYFTFQNIFSDKSFHNGVKLLPPGHLIHIDLRSSGSKYQVHSYWDVDFSSYDSSIKEDDASAQLYDIFERSVERQLVSDVEVGCYLSGGMDSGAITSVSAKQFDYIKTFTVGFDMNNISGIELSYDERERAEMLSYLYKTEHYEMVLKSGDMERCLDSFSWHLEEPRIGQSYPNYYAAKLASKFVKVVMAGTGGDEIFGGYPWRYYQPESIVDQSNGLDDYFRSWQRLIPQNLLSSVFAPIWSNINHVDTKEIFKSALPNDAFQGDNYDECINQSMHLEFKTFLHGLLVVEDKLSMAHSLESRVPFLDNELVDFAIKLPAPLRVAQCSVDTQNRSSHSNGHKKSRSGKRILRSALSNSLPDEYTMGTKQGFSSPDSSWFKGDSIRFVTRLLRDKSNPIFNFLNYKVVQSLIDEHLSGRENRRLLIWSLINFSYFTKNFM